MHPTLHGITYDNINLTDQAAERFAECVAHAEKVGLTDQLRRRLEYMSQYATHRIVRWNLHTDFAPLSFSFYVEVQKDGAWDTWFHGGLIYHGPHDGYGNGGAPTFSVSLSPEAGWSIHT